MCINLNLCRDKKQFIDSYYNIYKIVEGTALYEIMKFYIHRYLKEPRSLDMCKFETDLKIVEHCLDLDIYIKKNCYYIVLVLTDVDKFEQSKHKDLKKITIKQFKEELDKKFQRVEGLGTGNLLQAMNLIC